MKDKSNELNGKRPLGHSLITISILLSISILKFILLYKGVEREVKLKNYQRFDNKSNE